MSENRRAFLKRFVMMAVVVALGPVLSPSWVRADAKSDLAARFAARAGEIRSYKSAGKLGETTAGLLEAPKPADASADSKLQALINEENTDRQALYAIIAKDQGADVKVVALRAAKRNYEKALPGDWLKTAGGEWLKK